jgi:16S rRNA (uracil1498-N3)-methyltransferase
MQIFYTTRFKDDFCELDEVESGHCIRVLRLGKGNRVNIIDGRGNLHEGIIIDPDPRCCKIRITQTTDEFEKRNYHVHVAISPLKSAERFEWFVEKCVEIGVDEITPLICRNTEKPGIKSERIRKIIISAMKQSLKAYMPELHGSTGFNYFLELKTAGNKMIAHCHGDIERFSINQVYNKGQDAVMLIGPEGDFTMGEVKWAISAGYTSIHLGPSRLRTETAGIAACHSVYLINQ